MQFHQGRTQSDSGRVVDLRDGRQRPIGFIVDGAVADALGFAFVHDLDSTVEVAHAETPSGAIVVAKRSRPYASVNSDRFGQAVEALGDHGVRQIVSVSHRLLLAPDAETARLTPDEPEALTVGILPFGACTRLLAASFDRTENSKVVDGVYLRNDQTDSDRCLIDDGRAARMMGFCICLVEATTLRLSNQSTSSESALAEILMTIPAALSSTSSCYCHAPANSPF